MKKYIAIAILALIVASCGEYNKVLKSNDPYVRLAYAKKAFEQKKFVQAYTVLEDIVDLFRGKEEAEDALYLLALSYYENKDYTSSGLYFKNYYTKYPRGKYTELARYYCGYGYYLDSPEPQLDQSDTMRGIEELQSFLDYFPKSDKVNIAQNAIFELQDKLTLKELQNAQLYYNLGNYMGNNYQSAIIVAQNAIKAYPYSRYKEDLEMLVLKAKYQEADQSVDEKKVDRFREVVDEYYSFINNYPDGPNRKEADNILRIAKRYIGE